MPGIATQTGVEIDAPCLPHCLFLFSPKIKIDDARYAPGWGKHFFPLSAGSHKV